MISTLVYLALVVRVAPEDDDVCEGEVAMPRTSSDEPVNSVVRTSEPGGPRDLCDEEGDVSEGNVAMHRTGSDETVVSAIGTISPRGHSDETGSVAVAPGESIAMLSECWDSDRGTLDNICMWRVNPRSESRVCCEPSHGDMFDEGVFAFDLCPPGMMCKLDCPWVSPYLFVSLGKWFVSNQEQPVLADMQRHCCKPGGTYSTVGFPHKYTPVRCRDFAPEFDPELINRPSDLVNWCMLLCVLGGDAVSSLSVSPGLFDQALSQPALLDPVILVATCVHFDVFGPLLWMSIDTGDGDRLPVTTATRPLAGGSGCSGCCARSWRLVDMYLDCVHSAGISYSPAGDRVTACQNSLVLPDCCVFSLVQ